MCETLLAKLRQLSPAEFEHLVADLWDRAGYETYVSPQSNDRGIDVQAVRPSDDIKKLIQAKRYGPDRKVSGPEIQQYAALRIQEENVDEVVVVTTSAFTDQAEGRAAELGVRLIDGSTLVALVEDARS
jgi:restriction system protein